MNKEKKQYKLVSSHVEDDLNKQVGNLLQEGWELYGNPQIAVATSPSYGTQTRYGQAVVKSEKSNG